MKILKKRVLFNNNDHIYLFYNLIIIYVTAGQCILHKNEKLRYIFMR